MLAPSFVAVTFVITLSIDSSLQDGYGEKRPQFFPIYPQKMDVHYQAGFKHTKDGVQAAYRNDQRQEYVNNLAYKHGTGLGTAPWYGVPGTAYDFGKSKSSGHSYHTDPSHPTGYGYQSSVSQYHSQPSYGGHGHGHGGGGYKTGIKSAGCVCHPPEHYSMPHGKTAAAAAKYTNTATGKAAGYTDVLNRAGGYGGGGLTYNKAGNTGVRYSDLKRPAGFVDASYETLGYGYLY